MLFHTDPMRRVLITALVLLALACSDNRNDPPTNGPDDAGEGDGNEHDDAAIERDGGEHDAAVIQGDGGLVNKTSGAITIELFEAVPATDETDATAATTTISGIFYEMAPRGGATATPVSEVGDCALANLDENVCDRCDPNEECVSDNRCVPAPFTVDVGTITISGLQNATDPITVTLDPLLGTHIYELASPNELAYPPFAASVITLQAEGGVQPFSLQARAIEPLEVLDGPQVAFTAESGARLTWKPMADHAGGIVAQFEVERTRGLKWLFYCATKDDGELEIPRELARGFVDLDIAGVHTLEILRDSSRLERSEAARWARFEIRSRTTRQLVIPAFVACSNPGEPDVCPDGTTCLDTRVCGD